MEWQDPDRVVLDDDDDELDPAVVDDPATAATAAPESSASQSAATPRHAGDAPLGDLGASDLGAGDLGASDLGASDLGAPANAAAGTATGAPAGNGGLSEQWHDIQAMFVDDPQGSVQRAAQAADAAVSTLVESLRQSQAALVPTGMASEPADTEQLRSALRHYRVFCQRIADLDEQLPRADAMAR